MRSVDKDGFGKKNRDWNKPQYLQSWRENWAGVCNEKLREKGIDERIDHRTLKAQGIDRIPTIHLGVEAHHMERRGIKTERGGINREIKRLNAERINRLNPEDTAKYISDLETLDRRIVALNQGIEFKTQREKIAERLEYLQGREIAELKREIYTAEQNARNYGRKAEEISERVQFIQELQGKIDELRQTRQNMGIFESKKNIDRDIKEREHIFAQIEKVFRREFKIPHEQAEFEVARLESKAQSKRNLQEVLREKLAAYIEEREVITKNLGEYTKTDRIERERPNRARPTHERPDRKKGFSHER
jgi:hypothetical protein